MDEVRHKQLISGIGSVDDVCVALQNEHGDTTATGAMIREAFINLSALIDSVDNAAVADAICCAVLNRHFRKSYYLFAVGTNGTLSLNVETSNNFRGVIADTLGL